MILGPLAPYILEITVRSSCGEAGKLSLFVLYGWVMYSFPFYRLGFFILSTQCCKLQEQEVREQRRNFCCVAARLFPPLRLARLSIQNSKYCPKIYSPEYIYQVTSIQFSEMPSLHALGRLC